MPWSDRWLWLVVLHKRAIVRLHVERLARERAVFEARTRRWSRRGTVFLATRFAAKEAISKAVGLGMRQPMSWRAVEIVNEAGGRPCAIANGRFAAYLQERRLRLHVSVADLANLAIAQAVAETIDG